MKTIRLCTYFWLGICFTALSFGVAAETPQTRIAIVNLDIKAQPLGTALAEFSSKTGMRVFMHSDVGAGVTAPSVSGRFSPDEALEKLLSKSGLGYSYVNPRAVEIHHGAVEIHHAEIHHADPSVNKAVYRSEGKSFWSGFRLARLDQAAGSNDRSSNTVSERKSARIEEVIVTAQRRAENVLDVPVSIAVVTADDIDRRGLVGAADYLRGIGGVSQMEGVTGQSIHIRGIETNTIFQGFRGGATTATYFGETPTTDSAGPLGSNVDIKLVDIERVEVLRGPQGTAFGNSSMGGAVRTIPVAPKLDQFEGTVAAGYSLTSGAGDDNYNVQGVGNIPLIKDKLAIRATAYAFSDSGFYSNLAGSDAAFRAAWVVPFSTETFNPEPFATDEEEVGAYYVSGGRIAALLQASDDLRFTLSYLTQNNETDGFASATSGTYEQTLPRVAPEHVRRGQTGGLHDTNIDITNAVMEYDVGRADLIATYSYLKGGTVFISPFPAIGLNWAASSDRQSYYSGHIGEIRLATRFDGAWNFLAGLYAESNDDEHLTQVIWYGDPATNANVRGVRLVTDVVERRDLEQKAAFGEVSWKFLPGFTLTGGVRAYEYERTYEQSGLLAGRTVSPRQLDSEDSGANFRASLSYKPGDNTLLYAGWAEGFRLGRPQFGLPANACDLDGDGLVDGTNVTIESTRKIDSDKVDSYEFGGKFALLDRRLVIDAAVFRMEWAGMPVSVNSHFSSTCFVGYTANVGDALSEGVEFQTNLQLTDAFRVDVGGSWIHARLTEDVPAERLSAGDRLPGTPKVNANLGLQYGFDIGANAAFARADAIYIGSFYGDLRQSAVTKSGGYVKLDATARVVIEKLNLKVDFYVRNLTNEDAFTFRGAYNFPGIGESYGYQMRPRTIGVQFGYDF